MKTTQLERVSKALESGIHWSLHSGIQELDKSTKKYGGVYSWFDLNTKNYPFVYTEITGYYVTYMLYLNTVKKDSLFIERAKLAANYLEKVAQDKDGGFQCRLTTKEELWIPNRRCTFDAGMILCGVALLAKQDSSYKNLAVKTGDWLVDEMMDEHGRFYARKINQDKLDTPTRWSDQSGSFHCKLIIGLYNLYELTHEKKYLDAVRKIADWTLSIQERNGRFITDRGSGETYMHAHCYSAEGLLAASEFLQDKRYLHAAKKAVDWLFSRQNPDGSIPALFHEKGEPNLQEKTEMMAQATRLRLLTDHYLGINVEEDAALQRIIEKLLSVQYHSSDEQNGGFYYELSDEKHVVPYLNSWSTMFAVQALELYKQKLATGKIQFSMREYV